MDIKNADKFSEGLEIISERVADMIKRVRQEGKSLDFEMHGNDENTVLMVKWEIVDKKNSH